MQLWRQAILEAIFTWMWIVAALLIGAEKENWRSGERGQADLVGAIVNALMFLIYIQVATIVSSKVVAENGGQPVFPSLNPAVTLLQVLLGIKGPLAGLLFMVGHCVAAILAALAAKELLPQERIDHNLLGGCFGRKTIHFRHRMPDDVGLSNNAYFLIEFMFSFTFLYATTLLVTPNQLRELRVKWAVVLTVTSIGFNVYLSSAFGPGYSGSMFNPARCLGPAVAYGNPLWNKLWPAFTAPFVAAFPVALLLTMVPPDHVEVYGAKEDVISRLKRWCKASQRRGDRTSGDFKSASSRVHDTDLENNLEATVYEAVPSAAGKLGDSASLETPRDLYAPPAI